MFNSNYIHPIVRLYSFIIPVCIVLLNKELLFLGYGYIFLLACLFFTQQIVLHLKLILFAIIPFLALYLFVHYYILEEHIASQKVQYGYLLSLRLMFLSALFQYLFNIKSLTLLSLLYYVRCSKELSLMIIEAKNSIGSIDIQTRKIYEARLSRSYVKKRSYLSILKQFPFLLSPFLSASMTNAIIKSNLANQQKINENISLWLKRAYLSQKKTIVLNLLLTLMVTCWFIFLIKNMVYD